MEKKRLIDATDFLDLFYVACAWQDKAFISAVEMVVEDTPTVDAVEVVRCRDCAWYQEKWQHGVDVCGKIMHNGLRVHPNFFCERGERKEDSNGKGD